MDDQGIKMKNPAHPGEFLRAEIIEGRELTMGEAAEALGVGRPALSALMNGHATLTPEMALRMEMAFGLSMETLLRMQQNYDIARARARAGDIKVPPFVQKAKPTPQPSLI